MADEPDMEHGRWQNVYVRLLLRTLAAMWGPCSQLSAWPSGRSCADGSAATLGAFYVDVCARLLLAAEQMGNADRQQPLASRLALAVPTRVQTKMSCNCYRVLGAIDPGELEEKVHKAICEGMIPLGGVAIQPEIGNSHAVYIQAVCAHAALLNTALVRSIERALCSMSHRRGRQRKR